MVGWGFRGFGKAPETHEKHLKATLQWINPAGLISNLAKCHFRQAKLSPWVHSFSIVTETRSRLGLCSYRCSASKRNPKHSFLTPIPWCLELFPKYALGMGPLKMLLCSFLRTNAVQDQIFVDSSRKCWCLTEFEGILGRAVQLAQEYRQKLRASILLVISNFLVLPLLTQVWHSKTGEWGVSEEERGPR